MAKYKVEFENGEIKHTLTFRGQDFDYTMGECDCGMKSDKSCFSQQLTECFQDLEEDIIENEVDIDMIDSNLDNEDELFEILRKLEEVEYYETE